MCVGLQRSSCIELAFSPTTRIPIENLMHDNSRCNYEKICDTCHYCPKRPSKTQSTQRSETHPSIIFPLPHSPPFPSPPPSSGVRFKIVISVMGTSMYCTDTVAKDQCMKRSYCAPRQPNISIVPQCDPGWYSFV